MVWLPTCLGPMERRRYDATHIVEYGLLARIRFHSATNKPPCLYGDSAYPLSPYLICPYKNSVLTNEQQAFNTGLNSGRREEVEWVFGKIVLCCRFCFLTALHHIIGSSFHKCTPDVFPFLCSSGAYKIDAFVQYITNFFHVLGCWRLVQDYCIQLSISRIVAETCEAIWKTMKQEYVPQPTEDGFERQWNFPNCIGTLDGKQVVIQAPARSGSLYFNYIGSFSMVLMALVDQQYCFTVVGMGAHGRNIDGGI